MVNPLEEIDDFENAGIDLETQDVQEKSKFDDSGIDLEKESEKDKNSPSLMDSFNDILVQTGRGIYSALSWPLDMMKLSMVSEGLADLDELEQAYTRSGKKFDKKKYIEDVIETSGFIPTAELAEQIFEGKTGISLEPKTPLGKKVKQGAQVATLSRGGFTRKILSGLTSAGTTYGLEKAGVSEKPAEFLGDVVGLGSGALTKEKVIRSFTPEVSELEKTASKHSLPFIEAMTKDDIPFVQGKVFQNTEKRLQNELKISTEKAIENISRDEFFAKRLQDQGYNLESLEKHAYSQALDRARKNPQVIDTKDIIKNIDRRIKEIRLRAPSPSDAEKKAIELLQQERNSLKISKPTSENLINQHINYNADQKYIYKKPQFSGVENEIRKTYEFLKDQLTSTMIKQGHQDTTYAFKAANYISHETRKLNQTQDILKKAFDGDKYSPKKLSQILNSRKGEYLKRNMTPEALDDIRAIAKFGEKAQEKMANLLNIGTPTVQEAIKDLGQIAPFIFIPGIGKAIGLGRPMAKYVQGYLLSRPATREIYKRTMKNAAEGAFDLLKKDMILLEQAINKEFGSLDDFFDQAIPELEIYNPED